jgi:hypothetical protein
VVSKCGDFLFRKIALVLCASSSCYLLFLISSSIYEVGNYGGFLGSLCCFDVEGLFVIRPSFACCYFKIPSLAFLVLARILCVLNKFHFIFFKKIYSLRFKIHVQVNHFTYANAQF